MISSFKLQSINVSIVLTDSSRLIVDFIISVRIFCRLLGLFLWLNDLALVEVIILVIIFLDDVRDCVKVLEKDFASGSCCVVGVDGTARVAFRFQVFLSFFVSPQLWIAAILAADVLFDKFVEVLQHDVVGVVSLQNGVADNLCTQLFGKVLHDREGGHSQMLCDIIGIEYVSFYTIETGLLPEVHLWHFVSVTWVFVS